MMALTHHLIVHLAAKRARCKPRYALLGDDLLIVGEELYNSYVEVITSLRMKMSIAKTFKSVDLFEFAKRYHFKGKEISPFPLGAVYSSHGSVPELTVAIDNAITKG